MTLFPGAKQWLIGRNEAQIRAEAAEEIAAAIEGSVHRPAGLCDGAYCPCCARAHQAREDAATAREIGGVE